MEQRMLNRPSLRKVLVKLLEWKKIHENTYNKANHLGCIIPLAKNNCKKLCLTGARWQAQHHQLYGEQRFVGMHKSKWRQALGMEWHGKR